MRLSIYTCAALLLLAACTSNNKPETHTNDKAKADTNEQVVSINAQQRASAGIETGQPSLEAINGTITLQGSIEVPPQNTVNLSFPLGGYIKSTTVLPGKAVKKGETLAVIEDMQFIQLQQDYLTAKTNFALAEAEYNRQHQLNETKASSDKVFEQARAEMERQRILIGALSEKLKLIDIDPAALTASNVRKAVNVLSPITGYITKVNVTIGRYISPTDVLFTIIDPSDIHLALKVFEKDLPNISVGEPVSAYSNSAPDKRFKAKVLLVNRAFDADRMAEVHCHFDQQHPTLIPGMFMNGEVVVQDVKGIVVPEEAVVRWSNKYYVFVESGNDQYTMTEVKPGVQQNGKQQIESNTINQNTRLVLKNAFALLMKNKNTEEAD